MKCQSLFSGENKTDVNKMSSADLFYPACLALKAPETFGVKCEDKISTEDDGIIILSQTNFEII